MKLFDHYQQECTRTCPVDIDPDMPVWGLVGEVGELVNHLKKVKYHKHDPDIGHVKEELGDILWYVATLANVFNLSLSEIATANVSKLRRRYPEGFDPERSKNRTPE